MNADKVMDDLPPMEEVDVATLKPEDFPPKVEDDEGSKASSAASSDEFVKVSGKESEDDPLRRMDDVAPEANQPEVESFTPTPEPEDIPKTNKDNEKVAGDHKLLDFDDDAADHKLLSYVDPRASDTMDSSDNYLRDYYEQLPSETGYSVQFNPERQPETVPDSDKQMAASQQPHDEGSNFAEVQPLEMDENRNNYQDETVEAPLLVDTTFAAPPKNDDYLSEPTGIAEDNDIISYDEVDIETQPKLPIMSEVQQQNDIMVFDEEDDLIKPAKDDYMKHVEDDITQPSQTILTEEEPQAEEDAPVIEEPKQEVEEESPCVPETVEDVAPLVQLDEPFIPEVKEEEKPQIHEEDEDVKPVVAPPVPVEDIIEQPPPKESVVDARDASEPKECEDPVINLVHWRDVKQSATVLCFLLLVLGSLTSYSIISVCSYTGLTLLTVTMAFRIYKLALQTINGTQQPHPFQHLLDYDLNISEEQVHKYADSLFKYTNSFLQSARALLLVENVVNSLKLAVCLWLITFIGCWFNGLTLVITGVLFAFSVPPVYEKYQEPIDQNIALVNEKVGAVWSKVQAKIPALKPKSE